MPGVSSVATRVLCEEKGQGKVKREMITMWMQGVLVRHFQGLKHEDGAHSEVSKAIGDIQIMIRGGSGSGGGESQVEETYTRLGECVGHIVRNLYKTGVYSAARGSMQVLQGIREAALLVLQSMPLSVKAKVIDSNLYYHLCLLYLLCGGPPSSLRPDYCTHSFKQ